VRVRLRRRRLTRRHPQLAREHQYHQPLTKSPKVKFKIYILNRAWQVIIISFLGISPTPDEVISFILDVIIEAVIPRKAATVSVAVSVVDEPR
jgi:hypothetical protein